MIREATTNDAARIKELYVQIGYDTPLDYIQEQLSQSNNTKTYVAILNDLIVGVIEFHIIKTVYRIEPAGHISALIVDHNLRSQGIGSKLVQYVEEIAISLGCGYLEVACNRNREKAHKFYEHLGLSQASHCYFRKSF